MGPRRARQGQPGAESAPGRHARVHGRGGPAGDGVPGSGGAIGAATNGVRDTAPTPQAEAAAQAAEELDQANAAKLEAVHGACRVSGTRGR